jgi:hypothetical protein
VTTILRRLPALATTGVGSLPFERAADAAHHAGTAYELPFCPQLPRLYGDMIAEWLGADPGRCGWAPDRDRQLPGAWDAFIAELERRPPAHGVVKLQVTGPATLAVALERTAGRVGSARDAQALAGEIATWLGASAAAQATALGELGLDVLLIVDEPGLAQTGLAPAAAQLWDPLRRAAGAWGLHICGAVPWELVDAAEPDVLSFDFVRYTPDAVAWTTLARLVARGGRIMWGIVNPVSPRDPATATGLIAAAASALRLAGSPAEAIAGGLLSPSCGTGRLSIEAELRAAAILAAAADAVRAGIGSIAAPQVAVRS